jgi:hypothetical protein
MAGGASPVTTLSTGITSPLVVTALVSALGSSFAALPDLYSVLRGVMMTLGGLVVIAIILVVAIAIISGILGMIGKLRKRG